MTPCISCRERLSYSQERIWFREQLSPGWAAYNMSAAYRLSGPVDAGAFARSLQAIVDRHEALRTRFLPGDDGDPVQEVLDCLPLPVMFEELENSSEEERAARVRACIQADSGTGFDLSHPPLLRVRLLRLRVQEHVVVLVLHHIAGDGWSIGLLLRELGQIYAAEIQNAPHGLPELEIQYPDFAAWERDSDYVEEVERQMSYWRRELAGAPPVIDLPVDHPRTRFPTHCGSCEVLPLGRALTAGLHEISRTESGSLFMTLLAAFVVLLYRYSAQSDMVVAIPVANRCRPEVESLIGVFSNALPLRAGITDRDTFATLLARIRRASLDAYAHQQPPLQRIVQEFSGTRDPARPPLFQVMFVLQNHTRTRAGLVNVSTFPIPIPGTTSKFELTLVLGETDGELSSAWEYATDLFRRETILALAEGYRSLLKALSADPHREVREICEEICTHDVFMKHAGRMSEGTGNNKTRTSTSAAQKPYESPIGELEQTLCRIWGEVLGVARVGRSDNFFELGGYSIVAVRAAWRIQQTLGIKASIQLFFERPILGDFAKEIAGEMRAAMVNREASLAVHY